LNYVHSATAEFLRCFDSQLGDRKDILEL